MAGHGCTILLELADIIVAVIITQYKLGGMGGGGGGGGYRHCCMHVCAT